MTLTNTRDVRPLCFLWSRPDRTKTKDLCTVDRTPNTETNGKLFGPILLGFIT